MKLFLNIFFLFIIKLAISKPGKKKPREKFKSKYEALLKWGLNNSLNISKPLRFNPLHHKINKI